MSSALILLCRRGAAHPRVEVLLELLRVAREDPNRSIHEPSILRLVNETDAWRRAELELMLQAGT
jgi:hypothetical protein